MNSHIKYTWGLTKNTFKKFVNDKPLDYAAIIGFYTIFSLPALVIIMIRIAGSVFGQEAVQGELVHQINNIVGKGSAEQIQHIIENASISPTGTLSTIVGVCTMIFTATTVFVALQDSLNAMWEVKAKPEKGWLKLIIDRVLSLAMVVSLGFLLLVSLTVDIVLGIVNDFLREQFSGVAVYLITVGNVLISMLIGILIFAAIFKVLPDAKIRWHNVWVGATVTTVLFVVGKYMLNFYMQFDTLSDSYGAAGSLIVIFVWVYYTSVIFLLGAEFTQVYSLRHDHGIRPEDHAVKVKVKEIEEDN